VEARSALIQLTPPAVNTVELDVEMSEFQYELSLSDKQDGCYTVMYRSVPGSNFPDNSPGSVVSESLQR